MEKETMIANVRKMMQYADEKMKGIVMEDVCLTLKDSPYHYIKFAFYPNKQGSCIEFGSWDGTYDRMFADVATEYGGWCGGEKVYSYEKVSPCVTRRDIMLLAGLEGWEIYFHRHIDGSGTNVAMFVKKFDNGDVILLSPISIIISNSKFCNNDQINKIKYQSFNQDLY